MPRSLSDVKGFMDRERLASFVSVGVNNEPHVVLVFFTYENGKVYVQSDRGSVKVRNVLRNGNVAVAVYSGEEAVIVRGKARVVESDEEFVRRTCDHVRKCGLRIDEYGGDSLGILLFDKTVRCVIEVVSRKVVFW